MNLIGLVIYSLLFIVIYVWISKHEKPAQEPMSNIKKERVMISESPSLRFGGGTRDDQMVGSMNELEVDYFKTYSYNSQLPNISEANWKVDMTTNVNETMDSTSRDGSFTSIPEYEIGGIKTPEFSSRMSLGTDIVKYVDMGSNFHY